MRLFVRRMGAYAVDICILFGGVLAIQFPLQAATGFPSTEVLSTGLRIELWVLLTVSLPTWAYFAILDGSRRQGTLGKRLLRLRVTDASGARIRPWQAVTRTLLKVIPWEVTHVSLLLPTPIGESDSPEIRLGLIAANVLAVLYLLTLALTRGERSVHDFVAGTRLVETASGEGR